VKTLTPLQWKVTKALKDTHTHTPKNVVCFKAKVCMFCKTAMDQLVGLPTLGALIVYQCPNSYAHICVEDLVTGKGEQFQLNWAPDMSFEDDKWVVGEYHYELGEDGVMYVHPPNYIDKSGSMGKRGSVNPDKWLNDNDIKVHNACSCKLCGATAHLMYWGSYQCSKVIGHVADCNTGIWSDLTFKGEEPSLSNHKGVDHEVIDGQVAQLMNADEPIQISGEALTKFVKGMTSEKLDGIKSPMYFIDYQSDFMPTKSSLTVKMQRKFKEIIEKSKLVYKGGIKDEYYSTLVITDGEAEHILPTPEVVPYVPKPVLTAPRSAWGKKMKEKIDSLKATA
jgi:hypothetical protein